MEEAVLGVGNEMKSDDGVGKYIIDSLKKAGTKKLLVYGGTAPENVFHRLRGISSLFIVDAGDFSGTPGEIKATTSIPEDLAVSTHSTSIKAMVTYLKRGLNIGKITVILIQPKSLSFGSRLSREVKDAADRVVRMLLS